MQSIDNDLAGSVESVRELIEVTRAVSAMTAEQRGNQPDLDLVFYQYNLSFLLYQSAKLDESNKVLQESKTLLD